MVAPSGAVRARRGGALDRHRAVRPVGDRAGARHLRRRLGIRRAGGAAVVPGLCRDLAAGPLRARLGDFWDCFSGCCCSLIRAISAIAPASCRPISDITTDPANPPRFDVLARLRPRGRNDYPGGAVAQAQRAAYPDIAPLQESAPAKQVYDVALALVTKRKWHVVDARPPAGRPARRRDRGDGAHADHGFSRRRGDPRQRGSATARASICARPRATACTISAPMPRASAACSRISTTAVGSAPEPRPEPAKKAAAAQAGARPSDRCRRWPARRRSRPSRASPDLPYAPAPRARPRRSSADRCRYRSRARWTGCRFRLSPAGAGSTPRALCDAGCNN